MQIYCPIFLDLERKQYICTQQFTESMERIHLTKKEKIVLRHVAEKGGEGPWELPMQQVKCALYRLQDEGLIYYIVNFDEAVDARLTLWGRYYIEHNPKLKNPTLWHYLLDFLTDKERLIWLCITLNSIAIIAHIIKIMMMS